jgi:hypothetical protein
MIEYESNHRVFGHESRDRAATTSIGFEQQTWTAAGILRDNMDVTEYEHVVLEIVFQKIYFGPIRGEIPRTGS